MKWTCTLIVALGLVLVARGSSDAKAKATIVNELSMDISVKLDTYFSTIHPIDVKFVASDGNAKGVKWTVVTPSKDLQMLLMEMRSLVNVEHSVSVGELQEMMKAADLDHDGSLTMNDLAKHIAQRGLNKQATSIRFNEDKDKIMGLISKFGYIHAGEFTRLYRFCHQNFYRQLVDHICAVGQGRFYEIAPYKDLTDILKKTSDILSADNKDHSTERIKSCMNQFLEACKAGRCKQKRGFFSTLRDIIRAPFTSLMSSSVAVFRFNRPGQNA